MYLSRTRTDDPKSSIFVLNRLSYQHVGFTGPLLIV